MSELNHTVEVNFRVALQEERKDEITGWLKSTGGVVNAIADTRELPVTDFTVVLADDFAEVVAELQADSESAFSTERLGGVVAGKCLEGKHSSHYYLVLDGAAASGAGVADAFLIYLVAHEMTHAVLGHARSTLGYDLRGPTLVQGLPDLVLEAAVTAGEALDEWRADQLANLVLEQLVSVTAEDGETRAMRGHDLHGDGHAEQLGQIADRLHPGLVKLIRQYRCRHVDLETMYEEVTRTLHGALLLLAHAEANANEGTALDGDVQNHPAVRSLLRPVWSSLQEINGALTLLPSLDELMTVDEAVAQQGGAAVMRMYATLGLRPSNLPDGQCHVAVGEPDIED